MAIEVNTDEAPALIRIRCAGPIPPPEEQARLRDDLVSRGLLTKDSVSLLDLRDVEVPLDPSLFLGTIAEALRTGMPKRRACLINPGLHLTLLQQFQAAVPWMSTAAFLDEREAIAWLLNPEGAAGFPR